LPEMLSSVRYEKGRVAYLAQWRLKLGAEIPQPTEQSVAEVAAAVGYGSESAFNRAFKREFDRPPAQFRRQRNAATVQPSPHSSATA
jgi:AraC-like DNA-binding protein